MSKREETINHKRRIREWFQELSLENRFSVLCEQINAESEDILNRFRSFNDFIIPTDRFLGSVSPKPTQSQTDKAKRVYQTSDTTPLLNPSAPEKSSSDAFDLEYDLEAQTKQVHKQKCDHTFQAHQCVSTGKMDTGIELAQRQSYQCYPLFELGSPMPREALGADIFYRRLPPYSYARHYESGEDRLLSCLRICEGTSKTLCVAREYLHIEHKQPPLFDILDNISGYKFLQSPCYLVFEESMNALMWQNPVWISNEQNRNPAILYLVSRIEKNLWKHYFFNNNIDPRSMAAKKSGRTSRWRQKIAPESCFSYPSHLVEFWRSLSSSKHQQIFNVEDASRTLNIAPDSCLQVRGDYSRAAVQETRSASLQNLMNDAQKFVDFLVLSPLTRKQDLITKINKVILDRLQEAFTKSATDELLRMHDGNLDKNEHAQTCDPKSSSPNRKAKRTKKKAAKDIESKNLADHKVDASHVDQSQTKVCTNEQNLVEPSQRNTYTIYGNMEVDDGDADVDEMDLNAAKLKTNVRPRQRQRQQRSPSQSTLGSNQSFLNMESAITFDSSLPVPVSMEEIAVNASYEENKSNCSVNAFSPDLPNYRCTTDVGNHMILSLNCHPEAVHSPKIGSHPWLSVNSSSFTTESDSEPHNQIHTTCTCIHDDDADLLNSQNGVIHSTSDQNSPTESSQSECLPRQEPQQCRNGCSGGSHSTSNGIHREGNSDCSTTLSSGDYSDVEGDAPNPEDNQNQFRSNNSTTNSSSPDLEERETCTDYLFHTRTETKSEQSKEFTLNKEVSDASSFTAEEENWQFSNRSKNQDCKSKKKKKKRGKEKQNTNEAQGTNQTKWRKHRNRTPKTPVPNTNDEHSFPSLSVLITNPRPCNRGQGSTRVNANSSVDPQSKPHDESLRTGSLTERTQTDHIKQVETNVHEVIPKKANRELPSYAAVVCKDMKTNQSLKNQGSAFGKASENQHEDQLKKKKGKRNDRHKRDKSTEEATKEDYASSTSVSSVSSSCSTHSGALSTSNTPQYKCLKPNSQEMRAVQKDENAKQRARESSQKGKRERLQSIPEHVQEQNKEFPQKEKDAFKGWCKKTQERFFFGDDIAKHNKAEHSTSAFPETYNAFVADTGLETFRQSSISSDADNASINDTNDRSTAASPIPPFLWAPVPARGIGPMHFQPQMFSHYSPSPRVTPTSTPPASPARAHIATDPVSPIRSFASHNPNQPLSNGQLMLNVNPLPGKAPAFIPMFVQTPMHTNQSCNPLYLSSQSMTALLSQEIDIWTRHIQEKGEVLSVVRQEVLSRLLTVISSMMVPFSDNHHSFEASTNDENAACVLHSRENHDCLENEHDKEEFALSIASKEAVQALENSRPVFALHVYGSSATGLALPESDVDAVVHFWSKRQTCENEQINRSTMKRSGSESEAKGQSASFKDRRPSLSEKSDVDNEETKYWMQHVFEALSKENWVTTITPIFSSVPIIKISCLYKDTNIAVDLSFVRTRSLYDVTAHAWQKNLPKTCSSFPKASTQDFPTTDEDAHKKAVDAIRERNKQHRGVATREYVNLAIEKMPQLKPLVLVLKRYLKLRGLNDSFSGGIGSFALTITAIRFFQHVYDQLNLPHARNQSIPRLHINSREVSNVNKMDVQNDPKLSVNGNTRDGCKDHESLSKSLDTSNQDQPIQYISKPSLTIGSALLRYFEFYSRFNFQAYGISVVDNGSFYPLPQGCNFPVVIDDPVCPQRNLARTTWRIVEIQQAFQQAWHALSQPVPMYTVTSGQSGLTSFSNTTDIEKTHENVKASIEPSQYMIENLNDPISYDQGVTKILDAASESNEPMNSQSNPTTCLGSFKMSMQEKRLEIDSRAQSTSCDIRTQQDHNTQSTKGETSQQIQVSNQKSDTDILNPMGLLLRILKNPQSINTQSVPIQPLQPQFVNPHSQHSPNHVQIFPNAHSPMYRSVHNAHASFPLHFTHSMAYPQLQHPNVGFTHLPSPVYSQGIAPSFN